MESKPQTAPVILLSSASDQATLTVQTLDADGYLGARALTLTPTQFRLTPSRGYRLLVA